MIIGKNNILDKYSLFIIFFMSLTLFIKPELYTIFFILISLYLFLKDRIFFLLSFSFIKYLFILFFTGSFFILNNEFIYVRNDFGFLFKAIACFVIGFYFGLKINNINNLLKYLTYSIFLYSLYWLYLIFVGDVNYENYNEFNIFVFKSIPYVATIILPFIIFKTKNGYLLNFKLINRWIYFLIIFTGLLNSFSRNRIALSLISLIIVFSSQNRKNFLPYIISFFFIIFLLNSNIFLSDQISPIFNKFKNSFNEIIFFDGSDLGSIYSNWRGFEALKSYEQFQSVGLLKKIFGQSFGATVDLMDNYLVGKLGFYREIPYLHNGYFQILTKYGVLGIILMLLFFLKITFPLQNNSNQEIAIKSLKVILFIIFLFLTMIMTGIFNPSAVDHLIIFSGVVNGYLNKQYYNDNLTKVSL